MSVRPYFVILFTYLDFNTQTDIIMQNNKNNKVRSLINFFEEKFKKKNTTCYTFLNDTDESFTIDDDKLVKSMFRRKFFKTYEIKSLIAKGGNGVVFKGKLCF